MLTTVFVCIAVCTHHVQSEDVESDYYGEGCVCLHCLGVCTVYVPVCMYPYSAGNSSFYVLDGAAVLFILPCCLCVEASKVRKKRDANVGMCTQGRVLSFFAAHEILFWQEMGERSVVGQSPPSRTGLSDVDSDKSWTTEEVQVN